MPAASPLTRDNVQYLLNLGDALVRSGDAPEAIIVFYRALALQPDSQIIQDKIVLARDSGLQNKQTKHRLHQPPIEKAADIRNPERDNQKKSLPSVREAGIAL